MRTSGRPATPQQRGTYQAQKAARAEAEALIEAGRADELLKEEQALFVPRGGLCPLGWCFVASLRAEHGDLCRSCRDYVSGSNEGAWVCPTLCRPTGTLEAPFCQMADLLREDIMPSEHFGDAGLFPCRVGNDLQRAQAAAPAADHPQAFLSSGLAKLQQREAAAAGGGGSKKRAKHRLTEGSRKKLAKKREEREQMMAAEAAAALEQPFSASHVDGLRQSGHLMPTRAGQLMPAGWVPPAPALETLPPLPPPLLPDPPTPAPSPPPAPPFSLSQSYKDLGLSRLDEVLLLFILALLGVLGLVLGQRARTLIEACASEETQQRRRGQRLQSISDVARQVSQSLDATLTRTNALSASYETNFWTSSDALPIFAAPAKDPSD